VQYEADKVDVRDVCGAGDTFLAALVVEYLNEENIESSIKYANEMAARVVRKLGVSTP
jgi:D-beta-D-heptose 7-phosphate kinase/D-beta-D-heptose 1-phosphate adenosyltransferase